MLPSRPHQSGRALNAALLTVALLFSARVLWATPREEHIDALQPQSVPAATQPPARRVDASPPAVGSGVAGALDLVARAPRAARVAAPLPLPGPRGLHALAGRCVYLGEARAKDVAALPPPGIASRGTNAHAGDGPAAAPSLPPPAPDPDPEFELCLFRSVRQVMGRRSFSAGDFARWEPLEAEPVIGGGSDGGGGGEGVRGSQVFLGGDNCAGFGDRETRVTFVCKRDGAAARGLEHLGVGEKTPCRYALRVGAALACE